MLIQMLRNASTRYGCDLLEGQTGNVSQKLGELLVKDGIALQIEREAENPKKIKGVAKAPAIAEEIKPAIAEQKDEPSE